MDRVILADNQAIFRAGTARVLALEADMQIVAQISEADRLLGCLQSFRGSTVLFSTGLKADMNAVANALKETGCRGILIAEKAEPIAESVVSQLSGIILRSVTAMELVESVRRVNRGMRMVSLPQSQILQNQDAVGMRVRDRLTPKEMQIVALIVQGCKNKEIALQLGTKEQVIKNYLRSIYDKTGVSDRLELALFTLHHKVLAEAAARVGSLLERRSA
jgi:DNA-binding NarL/FixJ family response regulator